MINLIEVNASNQAQTIALYEESFPDNERKRWETMEACVSKGTMKMYVIEKQNEVIALAFVILDDAYLLLDYLAVAKAYQNQGIGSQILYSLAQSYPHLALLVEIEDYDVYQEPIMKKREAFYLRNGFQVMDYRIILFGIAMQILTNKAITFSRYKQILLQTFGPYCEKYVQLNEL
jgi:GNAT superfamily N-acetyltransferase